MSKIKALIVDDEPKLRKVLQIKLEQFCPEISVVGDAANIDEAYEKISASQPQLVFLDIAMPGGSGFDLINKFEQIDFDIIFVTGFNDYVLDALKISAVDYLLKPVITEDLINAVNKAKDKISDREKVKLYNLLKHNIDHIGEQNTKIAIPGAKAYDFLSINQIIRCSGWDKYTKIHLKDGNIIISAYSIGFFKDLLENYSFYSTHRSHLINTMLISRYLKEGIVVMTDGSEVPVARRKKEEFITKIINKTLHK